MNGTVRIGGALVLGILVILGALHVQGTAPAANVGAAIVAEAPARAYIESKDSDGDGVKDWEENLEESLFETITAPTSTAPRATEPYTPPTTLTGKFSEAFMQDYLQGKMDGADFSDPSAFVANAVAAVEKNTASIRHSRLELTLILTTPESVHDYGNELVGYMQMYNGNNRRPLNIVGSALEKNDPSLLAELTPIRDMYANTVRDALRMNVPDELVDEHIAFLNACEALRADMDAMSAVFSDPLLALARMREYDTDAQSLAASFKGFAQAYNEAGASFLNTELGAFFYLFDI